MGEIMYLCASSSQTHWAIQRCVLLGQQWNNSQIFMEFEENWFLFQVYKTRDVEDISSNLISQRADVTSYE